MKKMFKRLISVALTGIMSAMCITSSAMAEGAAPKGTITVTNSSKSVSINGKDFEAYKVFSVTANEDKYAYYITDEFKPMFVDYDFKTAFPDASFSDTSKNIDYVNFVAGLQEENDSVKIEKFANCVYDYAKKASITAAKTVTASNEKAVFADMPLGYYGVFGVSTAIDGNNEVATAVALDTTAWDTENSVYKVDVEAKLDAPTIDKNIVVDGTNKKATTASIGDKINFEITSKVPDITGYTSYQYVITDKLANGLTYNNDAVVTVGDKTFTLSNTLNTDVTESATKAEDPAAVTDGVDYDNAKILVQKSDHVDNLYRTFINLPKSELDKITDNITYERYINGALAYTGELSQAHERYSAGDHIYYAPKGTYYVFAPAKTANSTDRVIDVYTLNMGDTTKKYGKILFEGTDREYNQITYTFNNFYNKIKTGNIAKGTEVKITYSATVNSNAVIGQNGNYNTAKLTYSNNPHDVSSTNDTTDHTVKVYTFECDVQKFTKDGGTVEKNLAGAEFELYNGDNKLKFIGSDGIYTYDPNGTVTVICCDTNGKLVVTGLAEGEYTLQETKAPDGYKLLEDPMTININAAFDTTDTTKLTAVSTNDECELLTDNKGVLRKVENTSDALFPVTGGKGTAMFMVCGAILMVAAASYFGYKKYFAKIKKEIQ